MRLIYRYLLSGNNLNQLALAFQPDINTLAENLRFDKRTVFALFYYLGGRQTVKDILVAAALKQEAQALQMPAVHKLDALAEFALLKAFGIRNGKMRFGDGKAVDSVDAVDSREGIVFYLEFELLLFLGHNEACQIKVEFGEHDAYGL